MPSMKPIPDESSKPKPKQFCRVCKEYFYLTDKEFRAFGHYPNEDKPHLLEPDLGRSRRRHERALKRDAKITEKA